MSSLTEISVVTRKFFIWLAIAFACYMVLKITAGIFIQYWKDTHPVPVPGPNMKYNRLPKPKFTHTFANTQNLKFTLGNISGKPEVEPPQTATDAGKVYLMPKKFPSLLASERAKKFAAGLQFTDEPKALTETFFRFTDTLDPFRTLDVDTTNMNFHLKYDYEYNPSVFDNIQSFTLDQALSEVKNFIRFKNLFDETFLKNSITSDLLKFSPQDKKFHPASSLSTGNAVRINFFRGDLEGMKILPPEFNKSYNYAYFTGGPNINSRIIELNYIFWPITTDDFGTYPFINGETAWKALLDGKAAIVNLGNYNPMENIVIRKIYYAYYDSDEPESYLQPIFVFEGDNDFVAYLAAISPDLLD